MPNSQPVENTKIDDIDVESINIFDFDGVATIFHTYERPKLSPQDIKENTKEDFEKYLKHNDKQISAIASHHKNPGYPLTYILSILGLTKDNIRSHEIKVLPEHHHQLLIVHLDCSPHPFIISTPLVDKNNPKESYKKSLAWLRKEGKGKNTQIEDILKELPRCQDKHFYDDDQANYFHACKLPSVTAHLIDGQKKQFTEVPANNSLFHLLTEFKNQLASPKTNSSLFAENPDLIVVNTLLNCLQSSIYTSQADLVSIFSTAKEQLATLQVSMQGKSLISGWEKSTNQTLSDFIDELYQTKESLRATSETNLDNLGVLGIGGYDSDEYYDDDDFDVAETSTASASR